MHAISSKQRRDGQKHEEFRMCRDSSLSLTMTNIHATREFSCQEKKKGGHMIRCRKQFSFLYHPPPPGAINTYISYKLEESHIVQPLLNMKCRIIQKPTKRFFLIRSEPREPSIKGAWENLSPSSTLLPVERLYSRNNIEQSKSNPPKKKNFESFGLDLEYRTRIIIRPWALEAPRER